jgi:hypothetical protein
MYEETNFEDASKNLMSIIVRCIGLFLLLAGLWVAIQVLLEALDLYRKPQQIERFALAIERGSNIDKSLVSIRKQVSNQSGSTESNSSEGNRSSNDIRISYFFAWVIVLLLLLLIGRISLTAIKTGGELVLYDMQIKQFARMLAKESNKLNR